MRMAGLFIGYNVDLVQHLLLQAGDVETNPGPVPPGMVKSFLNDMRSIEMKYEVLGTKLQVTLDEIKAYEKMFKGDHVRIFAEVINRWLNSHEEEEYAELFLNEKKEFDRMCPTPVYHKRDYVLMLCQALKDIGELQLAEIIKRKCEHRQKLLKGLLQDLHSVVDKYATIGVELEVGLPYISLLEGKYQNDKMTIFANVLQCWMDNYSRDCYIQDISAALRAVQENDLAEVITDKYMKEEGKSGANSFEGPESSNAEPDGNEDHSLHSEEGTKKNSSNPHFESRSSPNTTTDMPCMKATAESATNTQSKESGSNEIDGIPHGLQLLETPPTKPPTPRASLSLKVPMDVNTEKLNSLEDTMKKNGDSQFPLKVGQNLGNIRWSQIEWGIDSTKVGLSKQVTGKVAVHFRIIGQGILDNIITGVKSFVYEALDREYQVSVQQ